MRSPQGPAVPETDAAIQTAGLRKLYPRTRRPAVDELSLIVRRGEFFGLLGPNGAGKSTTIGMLTTLLTPSGGRAWVAGYDVTEDPVAVKSRIGVVTQTNTLDRALTVAENLAFHGRYFGHTRASADRRALELLERMSLADKANATIQQLSGGQARRALLARALMHSPAVLFLDEPTAGVDPQARHDLWQTIAALHRDGQTIVLTTHYLDEAEALCQRLAIIDHGLQIASGSPQELKATSGAETVITVHYDAEATVLSGAPLTAAPALQELVVDGRTVRVRTTSPDGVLAELIHAGQAAGLGIRDATTTPPSLQTAFLTLTGRDYTP